MKLAIKKGMQVKVITGSDKGKTGKVIIVNPVKMLVKVEGIKMMTHYDRKEGITVKEGFIHYSNVQAI